MLIFRQGLNTIYFPSQTANRSWRAPSTCSSDLGDTACTHMSVYVRELGGLYIYSTIFVVRKKLCAFNVAHNTYDGPGRGI